MARMDPTGRQPCAVMSSTCFDLFLNRKGEVTRERRRAIGRKMVECFRLPSV